MKHVFLRIAAAIVLLAAIAGIAGFAYNAGMMRGETMTLQAPAAGAQPVPGYAYPAPFFHPFFGFGFLGVLVPLFLLFLAFGAMRRMIWGGWHMRGMHHMHDMQRGPWGERGSNGEFVPPMFAEFHRRAHSASEKPADQNDQKPA